MQLKVNLRTLTEQLVGIGMRTRLHTIRTNMKDFTPARLPTITYIKAKQVYTTYSTTPCL